MTGTTVRAVGGARIGWVNATWPFALLSVSEQALTVTVAVLGRYTFRRDQIVAMEPYAVLPVLGGGVRIEHTVAEYPRHIVFGCFGRPRSLINRIHETGFIPEAQPDETLTTRGMAVRWQALVFSLGLYCALLLLDWLRSPDEHPGSLSFLAVSLLFLGTTGMRCSLCLQRLVLKPGRRVSEIKHWLGFLSLVSGLLCIFFGRELFGGQR